MNRLQRYRGAARERGIPEHIIDWSLELARPRIELRPLGDSDGGAVGVYGGRPRLPPDVEWTGYPDFVASVDCAALRSGTLDIPLPEDGHLLFFANKRDPNWDEDRDGRVVYVPVGTETAERVSPDSDADYACEAFLLRGQSDWNMPEECFDAVLTDEKRKSLFDQYELGYLDDSTAGELTLGGYACPVQDDPCHGRWPDDDDEAWLLLAQATYGFAEISHHGVVFWMIRREDLAARNFENVKLVTQSYL